MEQIKEYISELQRFDANVKKHKNRIYTARYKIEKLERLSLLKKEVEEYSEALDEKCKSVVIEFNEWYNNAKLLLEKLNIKESLEEFEYTETVEESNMAQLWEKIYRLLRDRMMLWRFFWSKQNCCTIF